MDCENCNKNHSGSYASGRFCSEKCARSYATKSKRKEINKKVSKILSKKNYDPWNKGKRKERYVKLCKFCDKKFFTLIEKTKFCSARCYQNFCYLTKTAFENYKKKCYFKFNVYNFPENFNLDEINEKGWYKASNSGSNLNGISRDHILSIKEGFTCNIDPKIISHPANCELMKHTRNQKKNSKSKITLKELISKIKEWDKNHVRVAKSG